MEGEIIVPEAAQPLEVGWNLRAFHGKVRRARRAKGLTQKALAEVMGVNVNVISAVELLKQKPGPELRWQLADFLGLTEQEVWPDWLEPKEEGVQATVYQEVDQQTFSLLDSKVRDEVLRLEDKSGLSAEKAVTLKELLENDLEKVLKTLTFREREVIKLRYGIGHDQPYTLEEVARIFKVTRNRVSQIEAKALRKLQHPARSRRLERLAEEVLDLPADCFCQHCRQVIRGDPLTRFCKTCWKPGCAACMTRGRDEAKNEYYHVHKNCHPEGPP
jgi:RNA polymerase sigma factor (sigma-70 family)